MLFLPAPAEPRIHPPLLFLLCCCRSKRSLPKRFRCLPPRLDSLRFDGSQVSPQDQARCAPLLSGVDSRSGDGGELLTPSARAVAAAIRRASAASPVEFVQRRDKDAVERSGGPSPDFLRLCAEQMDLFHLVVDREAQLSVGY